MLPLHHTCQAERGRVERPRELPSSLFERGAIALWLVAPSLAARIRTESLRAPNAACCQVTTTARQYVELKRPVAVTLRFLQAENLSCSFLHQRGMGLALGFEPRLACLQNRCITALPHQRKLRGLGSNQRVTCLTDTRNYQQLPPRNGSTPYQTRTDFRCLNGTDANPYTNGAEQGRTDSNRVREVLEASAAPRQSSLSGGSSRNRTCATSSSDLGAATTPSTRRVPSGI